MGLINKVCSDEGLTLETSAKHHIPQAKNIPYQPLLIKPLIGTHEFSELVLARLALLMGQKRGNLMSCGGKIVFACLRSFTVLIPCW